MHLPIAHAYAVPDGGESTPSNGFGPQRATPGTRLVGAPETRVSNSTSCYPMDLNSVSRPPAPECEGREDSLNRVV